MSIAPLTFAKDREVDIVSIFTPSTLKGGGPNRNAGYRALLRGQGIHPSSAAIDDNGNLILRYNSLTPRERQEGIPAQLCFKPGEFSQLESSWRNKTRPSRKK